jgi:hypothetical protein
MSLPTTDAERKALPVFTYMFEYFPDAYLAEVQVAVAGNNQHNPGQPLHWAREKSKDQMNTAMRHIFDYGSGTKKDTDGQWHLAKAIWRLKAQLQLDIEAERTASIDAPQAVCLALQSSLRGYDFCDRAAGHDGPHCDTVHQVSW